MNVGYTGVTLCKNFDNKTLFKTEDVKRLKIRK
jgi:hypothetical protein